MTTTRAFVRLLLLVTIVISLSGLSSNVFGQNVHKVVGDSITIMPGDNAWNIAKEFTGDGSYWWDLTMANPELKVTFDSLKGWHYCGLPTGKKIKLFWVPTPHNPTSDTGTNDTGSNLPSVNLDSDSGLVWWGWLLIVLGIVSLIIFGAYSLIKDKQKKRKLLAERSVDPVTAGPPQVRGGVTDQNAYTRMTELVQQRYPGATFVINNIRRGRLSGPGLIHYAESEPREIVLSDVIAYAGEVSISSKIETIFFLQGCGNDARAGRYMQGTELVFTPDRNQPDFTPPAPVVVPEPEPAFDLLKETAVWVKTAIDKGMPVFLDLHSGDTQIHFDTTGTNRKGKKKGGSKPPAENK